MPNSSNKFFCLIYSLILFSCGATQPSTSKVRAGKMVFKSIVHGYSDSNYTKETMRQHYTFNKWYCGDLVIEEKATIVSNSVDDKYTSGERVDCYVFMDFQSQKAAEYPTFSDTARLLQKFGLYDSVVLTAGNIHQALLDTSRLSRHVDVLADTMIDNIRYKRAVRYYTSNIRNRPPRYVQIFYLRPDMPEEIGRLFFFSDSLTRSLKAPIVWAEERPSINSPIVLAEFRINFVADTLSKQEQKIFDTWKQNMKD